MNPDDPHRFPEALATIARAPRPPQPWQDATQLPWHDPDFSERMLSVHLDQANHMASRSQGVIRQHVQWLWKFMQVQSPSTNYKPHILDLGCGPGFYCHEWVRCGGQATGCDFAPAPLAYARRIAAAEHLDCEFLDHDLTLLPPDFASRLQPVDAITFWFGEFHSFPPRVATRMLNELVTCLKPDGIFVLEYQPFDLFPRHGYQEWAAHEKSVFSDEPHLWLQEFHWDEERLVEIHRHWILDAASGSLNQYGQCHQAYSDTDLVDLLAGAGLTDPQLHPPIVGVGEEFEFPLLLTRKSGF